MTHFWNNLAADLFLVTPEYPSWLRLVLLQIMLEFSRFEWDRLCDVWLFVVWFNALFALLIRLSRFTMVNGDEWDIMNLHFCIENELL